jgi:hypothetical protein
VRGSVRKGESGEFCERRKCAWRRAVPVVRVSRRYENEGEKTTGRVDALFPLDLWSRSAARRGGSAGGEAPEAEGCCLRNPVAAP